MLRLGIGVDIVEVGIAEKDGSVVGGYERIDARFREPLPEGVYQRGCAHEIADIVAANDQDLYSSHVLDREMATKGRDFFDPGDRRKTMSRNRHHALAGRRDSLSAPADRKPHGGSPSPRPRARIP